MKATILYSAEVMEKSLLQDKKIGTITWHGSFKNAGGHESIHGTCHMALAIMRI